MRGCCGVCCGFMELGIPIARRIAQCTGDAEFGNLHPTSLLHRRAGAIELGAECAQVINSWMRSLLPDEEAKIKSPLDSTWHPSWAMLISRNKFSESLHQTTRRS